MSLSHGALLGLGVTGRGSLVTPVLKKMKVLSAQVQTTRQRAENVGERFRWVGRAQTEARPMPKEYLGADGPVPTGPQKTGVSGPALAIAAARRATLPPSRL